MTREGHTADQSSSQRPLDECLREVLALQPEWTNQNSPDMERRGQLIRNHAPEAMRQLLDARLTPPPFDWAVQGRDGTGFKTRIPWIRVHSKTLSPSATEGWYIAYLFALDGESMYLSLNQGTAVPSAGAFKVRPADELMARADWARAVLTSDDARLLESLDLADNGELAVGYTRGNILALKYDAKSLPNEAALTDDLVQMIGLLAVLYDTPGAPEYSHRGATPTVTTTPSPKDEDAFVDWMRSVYGASLTTSRRDAEDRARELLNERAGKMTAEEAVLLGQLFNRGDWGGVGKQNRFLPAFAGINMEGLVDPIETFNQVTEHLWRDPIDDAVELAGKILISKDVLPGAGRSYPTMLLYLRDPQRFVIWLQITHRGLQAFGRIDEPVGRSGGAPRYLRYCAAAQSLASDHQLAPQEIDAILAEAARVAKLHAATGAAEIAALVDDAVEENTEPGGAGTEYPLELVQINTHLPIETLEEWVGLLRGRKKQALFYGPPGTGKTHVVQQLARHLAGADGEVDTVQFHPSYSYEDFIEGLRPVFNDASDREDTDADSGSIGYQVRPGRFHQFCERARQNEKATFVFIVDEINRAELGAVLGELMMLLEYRKTAIALPYSQRPFSVPENVILLATMNTADRSLALVDFALRRRFHAFQMLPDRSVLNAYFLARDDDGDLAIQFFDLVQKRVNSPDFAPGHSYWMGEDVTAQGLFRTWRYELQPYLAEYWFENRAQLAELEADVGKLLAEEA
jgi:hypothetical protein